VRKAWLYAISHRERRAWTGAGPISIDRGVGQGGVCLQANAYYIRTLRAISAWPLQKSEVFGHPEICL